MSGERAVDALLVDLVDQGFDEALIVEAQSIRQAAEWWGSARTSFLLHARGLEHHSTGVMNVSSAISTRSSLSIQPPRWRMLRRMRCGSESYIVMPK